MKRGILTLVAVALTLSAAGTADAAKELKGMWGPGYFRPEAPVGVRFWASDQVGVDIGIGLMSREYQWVENSAPQSETKLSFRIDGGVPVIVAGNESTVFFVRPGIMFESSPNPASPNDSMTEISVSGSLGVEHFFSSRFSVQVAHGLVFRSVDPGIEGSDSTTEFMTEDLGVSRVGFHYYLFPKE